MSIGLVNLRQELSVVLLLQLQVLVTIFRVRQVLCQLLNLHCQVFQVCQLWLSWVSLLGRVRRRFFGGLRRGRGRLGPRVSADVSLVPLANKIFVVHASLNNQETSRYEGLFKQLALEHLDEVFDADIRLLGFLGALNLRQIDSACCVGSLQLSLLRLLLLQQTDLVGLLECELGVLAVDALAVDRVA